MQTGPGRRCRLREGGHANPNTRLSQARIALASRAGIATTYLPVTVICTDPCPTPQLLKSRESGSAFPLHFIAREFRRQARMYSRTPQLMPGRVLLMPGLAIYTGCGPCAKNAGPGAFDAGRVRLPHSRACAMRCGCSMADRALDAWPQYLDVTDPEKTFCSVCSFLLSRQGRLCSVSAKPPTLSPRGRAP